MLKSFEDTSSWFKAGLVFVTLALVLDAVGLYLPNFLEEIVSEREMLNSGLWETCSKNSWNGLKCQKSIFIDTGWFLSIKILQCIGLGAIILTMLVSLVLLLAVTNKTLTQTNMVVCFFAISTVGAGTILTIKMLLPTPGTEYYISRDLGLSFYLCVCATASLLTAWVLFIVDHRKTYS